MLDSAIMRPGRLDQLVYLPLPDLDSRVAIFSSATRKSPLAADVDVRAMAEATDGFSGADITEICQRACKLAIRKEIEAAQEAEGKALAAGAEPPPLDSDGYLTAALFDAAMVDARRSVSKAELARYLKFRKDLAANPSKAGTKAEQEAAAEAAAQQAAADAEANGEAPKAAGAGAAAGADDAAEDDDLY